MPSHHIHIDESRGSTGILFTLLPFALFFLIKFITYGANVKRSVAA